MALLSITPLSHIQLLYWGIPSAVFWTIVSCFGDRPILKFLPKDVPNRIKAKKKDPAFCSMCNTASVAFVHSVVVTLLAAYCTFCNSTLIRDPVNGRSASSSIMAVILLGYFIWDIIVCLLHYKSYGPAFLAHAVISILLIIPFGNERYGCIWYLSLGVVAEISTPFLHLRWFMVEAKMFDRLEFQIVNTIFILLFAAGRLVLVEMYVVVPFLKETFSPNTTLGMPVSIRYLIIVCGLSWTALQYFWGVPLIVRQLRLLTSKTSAKGKTTVEKKQKVT